MALFSIPDIRLAGVCASVPKNKVSNKDFSLISEKERELLIKTTGIEYRRIADLGTTTSDLCIPCAEQLLEQLGWEKEEVNVLVFVTQTPDYITPATSNVIQHRMGLSRDCIALDINLGCSGYVYGLSIISSLLGTLGSGKGLLLVGDVSSACISEKDKSTAPIFSDAGSATALEWKAGAKKMHFNHQGDGKGYEAIIIPSGGYRNPVTAKSLELRNISEGIDRNDMHLILNGIDVYNFSVQEVPANIKGLLNYANMASEDIDYFVFHQANKLINESIRKKLNLTSQQVPYSLMEFGNTSSATIPVTMVSKIQDELQNAKNELIISGFGVGLSWSSAYLPTENIVCPDLLEI